MTTTTLLLTRPRPSAQAFALALDPKALAAIRVIIAPLMTITAINVTTDMDDIKGVIFTSANGVHHGPEGAGRIAFCVGAQTTRAAQARGWNATQAGDTAEQLIATLIAQRPASPMIHLGGEHTRGDVAQTLTDAGLMTRHVAVYTQTLMPLEMQAREALKGPCIVPVFSPRTAIQLGREAEGALQNAHIIALSAAVAAPLAEQKVAQMQILPAPRTVYMRKAVEILCLDLTLP